MTEERQVPQHVVLGDLPPDSPELTDYDRVHLRVYLRLLDAAAAGVPWRTAAREILRIDPAREPAAAKLSFDAHLARAQWMTRIGYRFLSQSEK